MNVVLIVVFGAAGALVRGEVAALEGTRRGTALVNLAGTFVLGLVVGMVGGPGDEGRWLAATVGLTDGLTTYSTWMLDAQERRPPLQAMSLAVTLLVGTVVAGLGWFLGALIA